MDIQIRAVIRCGVMLLVLAVGSAGLSGCSWIFVEQIPNPKSQEDCGSLGQAKKDVLGSGIMAVASTALGLASVISFTTMQSDTGEGIMYGANFAVSAGVLALPGLLWGLSSAHGYSSYWTCVEKVPSLPIGDAKQGPVP
jgi:hypothetical protein